MTTKVIAEDVFRLVPKGTHDWAQYLNQEELSAWFRKQRDWGNAGGTQSTGVIYVPGMGWKLVAEGQRWGNYFFGVRKDLV